jgi:hypothetical protein
MKKAAWTVCLLLALTAVAHAQADTSKKPDKKPVPDINSNGWSASMTHRDDSISGTSTTVIKRDMGHGWAVGGQMTQSYDDAKINGGGPPNLMPDDVQRSTVFGPYLEKRF